MPHDVIHPVDTQWHFPIMTRAGFVPVTREAKGLVRRYEYTRGDHVVVVCTGLNMDYFVDMTLKKERIWSELEKHLKTLSTEKSDV
jgi:hypothetical protein